MSRVLVISCTHEPFGKKGFLDFVIRTYKRFGCDRIVHCGDLCDEHRLSPTHKPQPEAKGAREELEEARKKLRAWVKAFPKMMLCDSNHDRRHLRLGASVGIPEDYFQSYNELYQVPKTWVWKSEWEIDGVEYCHGDTKEFSGNEPAKNGARARMSSVVIGHFHSIAGVSWFANKRERLFGMAVGCGVDNNSYAMQYYQSGGKRPMIGCGIVIDGKEAVFVPMELGKRPFWRKP